MRWGETGPVARSVLRRTRCRLFSLPAASFLIVALLSPMPDDSILILG